MGAPLHSGRKESFGIIEDLRESEVLILKHLIVWNYQMERAMTKDIARKLVISKMTAWEGLKNLNERGLAQKTKNGSWFLLPKIRKEIIDNLTESNMSELLQIEPNFMDRLEKEMTTIDTPEVVLNLPAAEVE